MTRMLGIVALVCAGCSPHDVYRQASEDLLREQPVAPGQFVTKRWVYEGPETDFLPWDRRVKSEEEIEACLTLLPGSAARGSDASPAAEITDCMAEKRWHIELKQRMLITTQSTT